MVQGRVAPLGSASELALAKGRRDGLCEASGLNLPSHSVLAACNLHLPWRQIRPMLC